MEEFEKIKTTAEHQGYYYKVSDVIKILILGLLCCQKTMSEIHGWASSNRISKLLGEKFGIKKISCYSHFTVLVGLIDSEELNKIFMEFFYKLVETVVGKTIAIDGKTVCSTANMGKYKSPLHIASAFVVENGITIGQLAAEGKGKEIPCVQELIRLLDIEGATVVTDALHCQKKTAKEILAAGADYVFSVKKNQKQLRCDKNNDIRVAVLPKDNVGDTWVGKFKSNKQAVRGEIRNKENIMLFAFYGVSGTDRQRGTEQDIHGVFLQVSGERGWQDDSNRRKNGMQYGEHGKI